MSMHAAKNILCIVLVVAINMAVMPRYAFEDISRNGILDLQDGILVAQEIGNVADTSTHIRSGLTKTITIFKAIADIDEVIKPTEDLLRSSYPKITFLISPCFFESFPLFSFRDSENGKDSKTICIIPEVPPPRLA